jgi:hypothetical protein
MHGCVTSELCTGAYNAVRKHVCARNTLINEQSDGRSTTERDKTC